MKSASVQSVRPVAAAAHLREVPAELHVAGRGRRFGRVRLHVVHAEGQQRTLVEREQDYEYRTEHHLAGIAVHRRHAPDASHDVGEFTVGQVDEIDGRHRGRAAVVAQAVPHCMVPAGCGVFGRHAALAHRDVRRNPAAEHRLVDDGAAAEVRTVADRATDAAADQLLAARDGALERHGLQVRAGERISGRRACGDAFFAERLDLGVGQRKGHGEGGVVGCTLMVVAAVGHPECERVAHDGDHHDRPEHPTQ